MLLFVRTLPIDPSRLHSLSATDVVVLGENATYKLAEVLSNVGKAKVYVMEEDARARGLTTEMTITQLQLVALTTAHNPWVTL